MGFNECIELQLNEQNKLLAINYLKGVSIFSIVIMHIINRMPHMPSLILTASRFGGSGVHVFFLCSGIGLYLSYQKSKTTYLAFLKKRFFKIYIPYVIVIIFSFFLPWMFDGSDRLVALLSHVFLFKMFIPKYDNSFGSQFWFISTLVQLYLSFIPMCRLKDKIKNDRLFFGLFMTISIMWWYFCYANGVDNNERVWSDFFLKYIWEFAFGIIIAEKLLKGYVFRIKI